MSKLNTSIRLKQIMKMRNLKQIDIIRLAEPYCRLYKLKLGRNDLSQYISGKVEPRQNKLYILAKALNVSEAWLMGFDVPMERSPENISTNSVLMTIGEKIGEIRKSRNLTIEQLAEKSGVPVSTIKKVSAGITPNPSFETVLAISKALECSLEEFMDTPILKQLSIAEQNHMDKYRALDDRGKTVVDTVLDIEYENAKAKYLEDDDLPAALTTLPPFEEIYEEQENKVFRTDRLGDDGYIRHAAFGGGVWKEKKKED